MSHYDVLIPDGVADVVALWKKVIGLGACGHLFCSVVWLGQWYEMLSGARTNEKSDSDDGGRCDQVG